MTSKIYEGLACPKCQSHQSSIIDSRARGDGTHRRRQCNQCFTRFGTFEAITGDGDISAVLAAVLRKLCPYSYDERRHINYNDSIWGQTVLNIRNELHKRGFNVERLDNLLRQNQKGELS